MKLVDQINDLVAGNKYNFLIDSLQNPWSTKTTGSFEIKLSNGNGYPIATQSSGVSLAVTKPSKFKGIKISRKSQVNGKYTSFTFNLTLSN